MYDAKYRDAFLRNAVDQSKGPDRILSNFFFSKLLDDMPGLGVLPKITRGFNEPDHNFCGVLRRIL